MDRKLLAEALLDVAQRSTTEIIEVADNLDLVEAAKRFNIKLPSPDLAVIKTIYAEIDKINRNGVVLPKKAVENGLSTLVGKQINWEHMGAGRVCGYIIDAKINNDQIEIAGVIFKSLFPEEMVKVKEKFEKKELAVSFEIWNKNPETGKSVVHDLENGKRSIDPIIFHGCGLLLMNKPACPKAKVYKLVANAELQEAEKIVEKVFEDDLVFAGLAIEEPESKDEETISEKEEKTVELFELMVAEQSLEITEEEIASFESDYDVDFEEAKKLKYEERQKLSDDDFAVVITVKNKVTGEPRKIRMFPIHDEAHVRNALARLAQEKVKETLQKLGVSIETVKNRILKRAKELNMDELLKRYERSEEITEQQTDGAPEQAQVEALPAEKVEDKSVEQPPEQAQVEEQAPADAVKLLKVVTEESVTTIETIVEDGSKVERVGNRKVTRSYSDGRDEVFEETYDVVDKYTMAEVEAKIAEVKASIETQLVEKDKEIEKQKIELDKLNQEIANLKVEKAAEEQKQNVDITVGNAQQKKLDRYLERRKKIDEIAYGKK